MTRFLKILIIAIPLVIVQEMLYAQTLIKEVPFIVASPFLEPDGRRLSIVVADSFCINLGKVSGGTKGAAVYVLEKRGLDLNVAWQVTLQVGRQENFSELFVAGDTLSVFSVLHDLKRRKASLKVYQFHLKTGDRLQETILLENNVPSWQDAYGKGQVLAKMEDFVRSGSSHQSLTPVQYAYQISFSPSGSKVAATFFDYSKTTLLLQVHVFDGRLKLLHQGAIPVDGGFLYVGGFVNDRGDYFILNTGKEGAIAAIRYNLATRKSQFLLVSPSSTARIDFQLEVLDNDRILVRSLAERGGELAGVMFTTFNFADEKVEEIVYLDVNAIVDSLSLDRSTLSGLAHYKQVYYIDIGNQSQVLVLEKRNYIAPGFLYGETQALTPAIQGVRRAQVEAGSAMILCIGPEKKIKWVNFIEKNQTAIANEGFFGIGILADVRQDQVQLIFEDKGTIHYRTLQIADGAEVVDGVLGSTDQVTLLRPYCHWLANDVFIMAGKRGFSGRSSLIRKYLIN